MKSYWQWYTIIAVPVVPDLYQKKGLSKNIFNSFCHHSISFVA